MADDESWRTAIHEAGHAVVAVLMGRPIEYVTIDRLGPSLGRTVFVRHHRLDVRDHRAVEREIALRVAGCVAEVVHDPHTLPSGCTDEVWQGAVLAMRIGHGLRGFQRIVGRVARMLKAIWPTVLVVASELERRRRLDGRVVRGLVRRELGVRRGGGQQAGP